MTKVNLDKHIWEGWTVGAFISALRPQLNMIMNGESYIRPFTNRKELAKWCVDNQPYYKKAIPEVVEYFAVKYNIK